MTTIPQRLFTAEEFAALDKENLRPELVQGVITAMPPAFTDHGETAMRLSIILGQYVLEQNLGKLYAAETGFLIARNPDTVRAPDLAFIQASRVTPEASAAGWGTTIPDLVAEVVSSGDRVAEIAAKVQTWLDAGVQLVWVLYPSHRLIDAHQAGKDVVTLDDTATLDGLDIVPGFSAPVARIFG